MPRFFNRMFGGTDQKDTIPLNSYEGFTSTGQVVLRDRRGTRKAEIPEATFKSETLSDDPLAIYKLTGAKSVDAARAMGNCTGWTYAAVNAIASEVVNIQLRLYQVAGDDHKEVDEHELLTLLDAVNGNLQINSPSFSRIQPQNLAISNRRSQRNPTFAQRLPGCSRRTSYSIRHPASRSMTGM